MRGVILDSSGRRKGRAGRVIVGRVEVSLVSSDGVPRPCVVVCHQVPEVEMLIHGFEVEFLVVLRAGGAGNGEEKFAVAGAMGVMMVGCGVEFLRSVTFQSKSYYRAFQLGEYVPCGSRRAGRRNCELRRRLLGIPSRCPILEQDKQIE